jgi:hypothetical protein
MIMYIPPLLACISTCTMAALQAETIRNVINTKFGQSVHKVIAVWAVLVGFVACPFLNQTYGPAAGLVLMSYLFSSFKVMEDDSLECKVKLIGLSVLTCAALGFTLSYLRGLRA